MQDEAGILMRCQIGHEKGVEKYKLFSFSQDYVNGFIGRKVVVQTHYYLSLAWKVIFSPPEGLARSQPLSVFSSK